MGLDDVVILPAMQDGEYAKNVGKILGVPVGKITSTDFEDSDPYFRIHLEQLGEQRGISGKEVFFITRFHGITSRSWVELMLFGNAAKNALVKRAHAIETYCGCSRQERISKPGEALSMQAKAQSLMACGLDTYTTFSIHAEAIKGFFDPTKTRFDSIPIWPLFVRVVHGLTDDNTPVQYVAPDAGAAKPLQYILNCSTVKDHNKYRKSTVIIHKDRVHQGGIDSGSKSESIVGSVDGCIAVLTDDEINSAGTICDGAKICKENGAVKVILAAAHGKYGRDTRGVDRLKKAMDENYIDTLIVTNTCEIFPKLKELLENEAYHDRIIIIPTEPLVADIIHGMVSGEGYFHLFSSRRVIMPYQKIARNLEDKDLQRMDDAVRREEIKFRDEMCSAILGPYKGPYAAEEARAQNKK